MNSKIKPIYICITPFFPTPDAWQGAYVLDQVKAIQRNSEYDVIVFRTLPIGSKEYTYEIDGVTVHAIAPLLMPSYILNGATEGLLGRMFLRTLRKMRINPMNIAYVHCHTANHAAFGFGVKSVNKATKVLLQFHDLDPLTLRNGKWANKKWNRRYRAKKSIRALNRADLLLCISEPVKDVILSFPKPRIAEIYESAIQIYDDIKDIRSLQPKDMYIMNNGVDTRLFKKKKNIDYNNVFRIGCIANFQHLKDHMSLTKAFAILVKKGYTDMRLSLLGTGETRQSVEEYLKKEGIYDLVEWPSEVSHEKLPDYYHSLDLFVLPSIYEGFGCVYTEAYACGVPFICCENQGAAECVLPEERDKWLVKPKNPEQLAEKIERYYLVRDEQHLCKPYDIDVLIKDFLKYIETL